MVDSNYTRNTVAEMIWRGGAVGVVVFGEGMYGQRERSEWWNVRGVYLVEQRDDIIRRPAGSPTR